MDELRQPCCSLSYRFAVWTIMCIDVLFAVVMIASHIIEAVQLDPSSDNFNDKIGLLVGFWCLNIFAIILAIILGYASQMKSTRLCIFYFMSWLGMMILGVTVAVLYWNRGQSTPAAWIYPCFYCVKLYSLWVIKNYVDELREDAWKAKCQREIEDWDKEFSVDEMKVFNAPQIPIPKDEDKDEDEENQKLSTLVSTESMSIPIFPSTETDLSLLSSNPADINNDNERETETEKGNLSEVVVVITTNRHVISKGAKNLNGNLLQVILKRIKKEIKGNFKQEYVALNQIGVHENIVQFYGVTLKLEPSLMFEYCSNGSLSTMLLSLKNSVPGGNEEESTSQSQLIHWSSQIANGLEFMSVQNVVHGNICADNILLSTNLVAKISGFSHAVCLEDDKDFFTVQPSSNIDDDLRFQWRSLENLENLIFSTQSDVWAFAVLLWEIFSLGDCPWPSLKCDEYVELIRSGERLGNPVNCPLPIYEAMCVSWNIEPCNRGTVEDLKKLLHLQIPD